MVLKESRCVSGMSYHHIINHQMANLHVVSIPTLFFQRTVCFLGGGGVGERLGDLSYSSHGTRRSKYAYIIYIQIASSFVNVGASSNQPAKHDGNDVKTAAGLIVFAAPGDRTARDEAFFRGPA